MKIMSNALKEVHKYTPEILTGLGIAGMVTTVVLAVKATPKAVTLIQNEKEKLNRELKPIETVKAAGRCYIPAAVVGVAAIGCLVGGSSVAAKRNAALAVAYSISETAAKEYQEKVIEEVGEKKEQDIRDAVARDKIQNDPVRQDTIVNTGMGTTLCYDAWFGRYFYSDIDKLKKIENKMNRQMIGDMCVSLNEFYSEVGLPESKAGDMLGWNVNKGLIEMQFSSQLTQNDVPCLVIGFRVPPVYEYEFY